MGRPGRLPRDPDRVHHRPGGARDVRLPGPHAGLARRPGDRDHRLRAADAAREPWSHPQPPDEPVHLEALEAPLPVAREPLRVRRRLPRRPHRQHHPRPVRRRRHLRVVRAGAVRVPKRPGRARHAGPLRGPRLGDHGPLVQPPAQGPVAQAPPFRARRLDRLLAPRPARGDGQHHARPALRRDGPGRHAGGRVPLLGLEEGPTDVRHLPAGRPAPAPTAPRSGRRLARAMPARPTLVRDTPPRATPADLATALAGAPLMEDLQ